MTRKIYDDYACIHCRHALGDHNLVQGCSHCRCAATPSEGAPRCEAEDRYYVFPPDQFLKVWQNPAEPDYDASALGGELRKMREARAKKEQEKQVSWTNIKNGFPADGERCEVITEGGDQRELVFERGLWWLPDQSMYVYFVPVFWRAT